MHFTIQNAVNSLTWLVAALTMGCWTVLALVRPVRDEDHSSSTGRRLVGISRIGAGVMTLLNLCMAVLPVGTGDHSSTPWVVATVASALALACTVIRRWEGALYVLGASALALVAPVAAAENIAPRNQDLTGDADMIAVVATALLAGTWLASRLLPRDELALPLARLRLRVTSTAAASLVVLADVVGLLAQRPPSGGLDAHATWRLVRIACAVVVLAVAWAGAPALGLLAALAGVVGVFATAQLHRTIPAVAAVPVPHDVAALGYSVAAWPTLGNLVLHGRVNLLLLLLAVAAVAYYLWLVARLRRRGDAWPVGRTAAWLIGWVLVVFMTSSGIGRYAPAVFSVHMFMNLGLNMLCAMVLVLAGFITLVLRATPARGRDEAPGMREWVTATMHSRYLGFFYNPIIALVFMTGTYYVFYLTGMFTSSLHTHWLHQFFYLHFLISGYIFYGLIIGVDQPPHPLPHIGKLGLIIGAMPFHAFFGVILMSKGTIFGESFLNSLGYTWLAARGLLHDQWVGGTIAWAGGEFPLVIALIALLTQWRRQDNKESRRIDRHLDQGTDQSYDAYNEMLSQLAERDRSSR